MSTNVGSTLNAQFNYDTLTGAYIADEYITVAALASGDNTVVLPAGVVGTMLEVLLGRCPDGVVLLVKSFTQVTLTYASPAAYAAGTSYSINNLVTYNSTTYVSLQDTNSGHTPGAAGSAAYWQVGGTFMTTCVINAANTAAGGCTLVIKVGTN